MDDTGKGLDDSKKAINKFSAQVVLPILCILCNLCARATRHGRTFVCKDVTLSRALAAYVRGRSHYDERASEREIERERERERANEAEAEGKVCTR